MRLAFVLHNYFPYGGLQRDALRIAQACLQRHQQVEFLTMRWDGEDPHVPVHIFPQDNWINYRRYQSFADEIQVFTQQQRYDGVIGFNKMAGLDIYYAADPCFAATLAPRPAYYRWLPRYRYFLNAEAEVCSPATKTELLLISPQAVKDFANYYHTPAERLHLLPPGIARDRCAPPDAAMRRHMMRAQLGVTLDQKIILALGSGFKTKGVDRSIRAFAALPDELRKKTRLLVVGKDKSTSFQRLANQLQVGQYVQFILGSDQVPDLLLAADILLHPAYLENTGTVLLEALVAGLPVLTTENCGYAFYVQQAQAGMVLPMPFIQQSLNEQLAFMLTSTDQVVWQQNGIAFGQQHDLYSMPEVAADLIIKLLSRKKKVSTERA